MEGNMFSFLDTLLTTFKTAGETGMINLRTPALGLATVLGILDITAMWGLYFGEMRIKEIIGKVIKIGFFVFLIMNWGPLTTTVEDTFKQVGNIAAGQPNKFEHVSDIMVEGTDKMYRLWNNAIYDVPLDPAKISEKSKQSFYDENGKLKDNYEELVKESEKDFDITNPFAGVGEAMAAIPGRIIKIILALLIFAAFAFIALNVLLCFIEYIIVTTLAIILLPFGVNGHTSFISQKALGAVVNFGVKLMVMMFLLGLTSEGISKMAAIQNDDYGKLFAAVLEAVMYAFLIWKMPGLISGMLSGTPSMGASAGGVAGAIGGASRMAGGAAMGATTSAVRAASNATRVGNDALRAGSKASGSASNPLSTSVKFWGAAAKHVGATAKASSIHQINKSKSAVLNRLTPKANETSKASRIISARGGYGRKQGWKGLK